MLTVCTYNTLKVMVVEVLMVFTHQCHGTGQLHEGHLGGEHYPRLDQDGGVLLQHVHRPHYLHSGICRCHQNKKETLCRDTLI